MGTWEGRPMEEVRDMYPHAYERRGIDPVLEAPPEGESFSGLSARIIPVFEDILERARGPILMVGHAGVNRVILCHLLGIPLKNLFLVGQDYGCLNYISRKQGGVRVILVNYLPWIDVPGSILEST